MDPIALTSNLLQDLRVMLPRNKIFNYPGMIVISGAIPKNKRSIVRDRLSVFLAQGKWCNRTVLAGKNSIIIPV